MPDSHLQDSDTVLNTRTGEESKVTPRRSHTTIWLRGAPLAHRRWVWRMEREERLWPRRAVWRYIIFGRWPGRF